MSLASLKELSFSWMSFIAGTASAVTSAAKAILSKKVLDGKPLGENLTPANMFAILSIIGAPATAAAAAAAAAAPTAPTAAKVGEMLRVMSQRHSAIWPLHHGSAVVFR